MKNSFKTKALALALSICLLVSIMTFATLPVSAVSGMWETYGPASESVVEHEGEKQSVPGYYYTEEGFHMTAADWSTSSPFSQMSTRNRVDLKEGVYMEVRIDEFSYDAYDKWFNFFLWSTPTVEPGVVGYGEGVQTIIRPSNYLYDGGPGKLTGINWYMEEFTGAGASSFEYAENYIIDGKNYLTFEVTYDQVYGFSVSINGSAAPEKIIEYMNEHFAEDSMAYVGFAMHSSKTGGIQEATILKFGTSEADATKPLGDDSKDPINYIREFAPIIDPDTVEAGAPAILMTGDIYGSHLSNVPVSNIGTHISFTPDQTVQLRGSQRSADAGKWLVDSDTSFLIEDFPVVMCITKNLCACQSDDGVCYAFEQASTYVLTGDKFTADNSNKCNYIEICLDSYVIGDDSYLYFWYDTSWDGDRFRGRINGTHFDFTIDNETLGANEFEVVLQAFFKTEEDAEAYAEAYFEGLGWEDPKEEEDAYYRGYDEGYPEGLNAGAEAGFKDGFGGTYGDNFDGMVTTPESGAYMQGYVSGYNQGFSDGYEEQYAEAQILYGYYMQGYNDGCKVNGEDVYNQGFEEGYDKGYNKGYNEGYNAGYNEGYKDGCNNSGDVETGVEETETDEVGGGNSSYEAGYIAGYNKGYSDGSKQSGGNGGVIGGNGGIINGGGSGGNGGNGGSYEEGYNDGYSDAIKEIGNTITSELKGCENSIGGAAIILLTAIPAAFFIFKRKKDD